MLNNLLRKKKENVRNNLNTNAKFGTDVYKILRSTFSEILQSPTIDT